MSGPHKVLMVSQPREGPNTGYCNVFLFFISGSDTE
jgi:hypothetical protein